MGPEALAAVAERAEQRLAEYDAEVVALEAAERRVTDELATALGDGVVGEIIGDLADRRDAVQSRLVSRTRDRALAKTAAEAARSRAVAHHLEGEVRAVSAELVAADRRLEELLGQLAEAWQARVAGPDARAGALAADLAAYARRHKTGIAPPSADGARLTPSCYALARRAGPELATLAALRQEAAHPTPPSPTEARPYLIAGTSPRARAQRVPRHGRGLQ